MGFVIRGQRKILGKVRYVYCTGIKNNGGSSWSDKITDAEVFDSEQNAQMCRTMCDDFVSDLQITQSD